MGFQKYFTKIQRMKNIQTTIKPIKIGKQSGTTYCFGCKDYTYNFMPEKVKNLTVLFVDQISRGFSNKNTTIKNNYTLQKLML